MKQLREQGPVPTPLPAIQIIVAAHDHASSHLNAKIGGRSLTYMHTNTGARLVGKDLMLYGGNGYACVICNSSELAKPYKLPRHHFCVGSALHGDRSGLGTHQHGTSTKCVRVVAGRTFAAATRFCLCLALVLCHSRYVPFRGK